MFSAVVFHYCNDGTCVVSHRPNDWCQRFYLQSIYTTAESLVYNIRTYTYIYLYVRERKREGEKKGDGERGREGEREGERAEVSSTRYSLPCLRARHPLPCFNRERELFYLTMQSTHFIYGYMASDIWLRTILIVREETCCRHIGYSYQLTARVLLYSPSHRKDSTYHSLCYTSRGAVVHPMKN